MSCSGLCQRSFFLKWAAVNGETHTWLVKMLRRTEWVLSSKLDICINPSITIRTQAQRTSWKKRRRGCRKSRRMGQSTVKHYLRNMASLLHYCACSKCGWLHKPNNTRASQAESSLDGINDLRPHPLLKSYWQCNCQGKENHSSLKTWTRVNSWCSSEWSQTHGQLSDTEISKIEKQNKDMKLEDYVGADKGKAGWGKWVGRIDHCFSVWNSQN